MDYFKNLKLAFQRPYINGLDGKYFRRAANPLELFFDLIFVVTLAKVAGQFNSFEIENIFYSLILYLSVFMVWYNVTKYAMYFISNQSDYFLRGMIFLIMVPILLVTGIENYQDPEAIRVVAILIGISRIITAYIWRDAIINAPINHIATSRKYKFISQGLKISGLITLSGFFLPEYFLFFLLISLLIEIIYMPLKVSKKHDKGVAEFDPKLFNERKLLFVILIFGEGIIQTFSHFDITQGINNVFAPLMIFAIIYLFFLRISEETQIQNTYSEVSSIFQSGLFNFILLMLLAILNDLQMSQIYSEPLIIHEIYILVGILIYISITHYWNNYSSKNHKKDLEKFYQLDQVMNLLMLGMAAIIFLYHPTANIVILEVLVFFILHTLSVPLRFKFLS